MALLISILNIRWLRAYRVDGDGVPGSEWSPLRLAIVQSRERRKRSLLRCRSKGIPHCLVQSGRQSGVFTEGRYIGDLNAGFAGFQHEADASDCLPFLDPVQQEIFSHVHFFWALLLLTSLSFRSSTSGQQRLRCWWRYLFSVKIRSPTARSLSWVGVLLIGAVGSGSITATWMQASRATKHHVTCGNYLLRWQAARTAHILGTGNACQIRSNVACAKLKLWMVFDNSSWAQSNKY